jgi:hypothetical protein
VADDALLWSVPRSELAASAARVAKGGDRARLIWAPLLVDEDLDAAVAAPPGEAGYVVLNSRPETRRAWGVDEARTAEIRRGLVAGERVAGLVPEAALRDVLLPLGAIDEARALYASVGAAGVAVAAGSVDAVAPRVAWARAVRRYRSRGKTSVASVSIVRSDVSSSRPGMSDRSTRPRSR